MKYEKIITLRNGKILYLRSAKETDAKGVLENFITTHSETDYLFTYPEETHITIAEEAEYLKHKYESDNEIEIVAIIDGKVVGTAGIAAVGDKIKNHHRAEFGVSVLKNLWGCGIGNALLAGCIESAKKAGYEQVELSVVASNDRALTMYRSNGFKEYGRNPRGYKTKFGIYQELILMRLELKK